MTNTWKPTNRLTDDTVLFDAIGKIRESSDKRREIEARVLAENNLASVRQLSEDKKKQFCAIVDAILAEQADVNTQLFADDKNLAEAASKIKVTPWTKQDNNPEKNSTFMGAPKTNPNKGGYAGGAKAEKTKNGYTAMKRIKEEEEVIDEGIVKNVTRAFTGRKEAAKRSANLDHPIRKAQLQSRSVVHGKASSDQGMSRFVSRLSAKNQYDKIASGKPGLRFGTRKEEVVDEGLIKTAVRSVAGRAIANDRARKTGIAAYSAQNKAFAPGTSEADRGKLLKTSKPKMKAYNKYHAISMGRKAPGSFGTRKEDLEEMYLDIQNFVLESEGIDSIDRLNEQGQEKLAAVVESVMEEIVKEGWFDDQKKKNFDDNDQLRKDALTNPKNAITHPSKAISHPSKAISHPSKAYISKPLYTSSRDKEGY